MNAEPRDRLERSGIGPVHPQRGSRCCCGSRCPTRSRAGAHRPRTPPRSRPRPVPGTGRSRSRTSRTSVPSRTATTGMRAASAPVAHSPSSPWNPQAVAWRPGRLLLPLRHLAELELRHVLRQRVEERVADALDLHLLGNPHVVGLVADLEGHDHRSPPWPRSDERGPIAGGGARAARGSGPTARRRCTARRRPRASPPTAPRRSSAAPGPRGSGARCTPPASATPAITSSIGVEHEPVADQPQRGGRAPRPPRPDASVAPRPAPGGARAPSAAPSRRAAGPTTVVPSAVSVAARSGVSPATSQKIRRMFPPSSRVIRASSATTSRRMRRCSTGSSTPTSSGRNQSVPPMQKPEKAMLSSRSTVVALFAQPQQRHDVPEHGEQCRPPRPRPPR